MSPDPRPPASSLPVPRDRIQRLLPLLALAQAASLIDHVAATGSVDQQAMSRLLDNLLLPGGQAALGGVEDYRIGRRALLDLLSGDLPENQARLPVYMRAMLRQEGRLARRPELLEELRGRLARAARMREHFASEPASVYAAVAGAYDDSIGRLHSRIQVVGALRQLTDKRNADIIRCALLGGIRAAGLWRRAGGRWWELRWRRRRLLRQIQALPER